METKPKENLYDTYYDEVVYGVRDKITALDSILALLLEMATYAYEYYSENQQMPLLQYLFQRKIDDAQNDLALTTMMDIIMPRAMHDVVNGLDRILSNITGAPLAQFSLLFEPKQKTYDKYTEFVKRFRRMTKRVVETDSISITDLDTMSIPERKLIFRKSHPRMRTKKTTQNKRSLIVNK